MKVIGFSSGGVGREGNVDRMVKAILGDKGYQALSIDSSNGKRSGMNDLARTLAQLAALGYKVDLGLWDCDYAETQKQPEGKKPGMTVSLTGANYFNPPAKRPAVQSKLVAAVPTGVTATRAAVNEKSSAALKASAPVSANTISSTDGGSLQQALQMT